MLEPILWTIVQFNQFNVLIQKKGFFVWEAEKLFSFAQLYHALACKHLAGMPQYKLNIGIEMFSACLNSVVPKLGGATPRGGGGEALWQGGRGKAEG